MFGRKIYQKKRLRGKSDIFETESGTIPNGECVCVKCGYESPKNLGIRCIDERCPKCGAILLRKGGFHYKAAKKKIKIKEV